MLSVHNECVHNVCTHNVCVYTECRLVRVRPSVVHWSSMRGLNPAIFAKQFRFGLLTRQQFDIHHLTKRRSKQNMYHLQLSGTETV